MKVEAWTPETHLPLLGSWLKQRGQANDAGDARLYPSTGFVVDQCAIGFLYCTDAPLIGYLDGIVTDPAASARRRYAALTRLCTLLSEAADAKGIRQLVASTRVSGLLRICKRNGFRSYETGHEFIVRFNPKET